MKRFVAIGLTLLLTPLAAAAQDASAFAQLQLYLRTGDIITVTDPSGISTRGKVETVSRSMITMWTGNVRRVFERQDVVELKRQYRDRVGDGARRGLIVGMALGVVMGTQAAKSRRYSEAPGAPVGGAVVGALYGAVVGAIADSLKKSDRTLYRAPGTPPGRVRLFPVVSEEQKGMMLNISF